MSQRRVLLTNDDGIDATGIRALYDALSALDTVDEVVAVAPADDQSAVGRALTGEAVVHEHELGYALEGTPADCAIAGLEALTPAVDAVVAGCNKGANLGAYVLGRSGTVSACVEAAFFDIPAIAVSQYFPGADSEWRELGDDPAEYRHAVDATAYLVENALDAGVFEDADYLNVNAPYPDDVAGDDRVPMRVTTPSKLYDMTAQRGAGEIHLKDRVWRRMREGDVPDPVGTDRRAIVDGEVSVSPLTAPHSVERHESLDGLAEAYGD